VKILVDPVSRDEYTITISPMKDPKIHLKVVTRTFQLKIDRDKRVWYSIPPGYFDSTLVTEISNYFYDNGDNEAAQIIIDGHRRYI